jgi:hypothetical protein
MQGFIDQVEVEFITNGVGNGETAQDVANGRYSQSQEVSFDPGILRPVIMDDGKRYCSVNTGRLTTNSKGEQEAIHTLVPLQTLINNGMVPYTYNTAALPHQVWQRIDRSVIKASRDRLNAWNDLAAANTYGGFNGMAVTSLIRDTMTDAGDAKVDMDTLSDDFNDSPLFTPDILPLPIIHAGAAISQRKLATSRNGGMPLDTTMIEQSGRRCSETLEKMTIGTTDFSGLVIGDDTTFTNNGIYGFRTQPQRITKTDVTASASFVPSTFVNEVLAMKELARAQNLYGPFVLYYSTTWDQYLDRDYYAQVTAAGVINPTETVRQRVERIEGISRVAMLDTFSNTDELLLVQMSSESVRAVNGMDFTTVQWSKDGGSSIMLRVMGIKVPDLRSQYVGTDNTVTNRVSGIVHGTTS